MRTRSIGLGLARISAVTSEINLSSAAASKPSWPGRISRPVSTTRMTLRSRPSTSHSCQLRRNCIPSSSMSLSKDGLLPGPSARIDGRALDIAADQLRLQFLADFLGAVGARGYEPDTARLED